jgi:hypothetical protein
LSRQVTSLSAAADQRKCWNAHCVFYCRVMGAAGYCMVASESVASLCALETNWKYAAPINILQHKKSDMTCFGKLALLLP